MEPPGASFFSKVMGLVSRDTILEAVGVSVPFDGLDGEDVGGVHLFHPLVDNSLTPMTGSVSPSSLRLDMVHCKWYAGATACGSEGTMFEVESTSILSSVGDEGARKMRCTRLALDLVARR